MMNGSRENKIMKALNPLGAVVCATAAFGLASKSTWFKGLSPKKRLVSAFIALFYLLSTVVAAILAYCKQWRQRMRVSLKMKLLILTFVSAALYFLSYVYGDRRSDYHLMIAFVCSAFHFHFGAHSFRYLEDYGLAQGLMSIAVSEGMHLAKEWPMLLVPLLGGTILSALYNLYLTREARNEEDKRIKALAKTVHSQQEIIIDLRKELQETHSTQVQDPSPETHSQLSKVDLSVLREADKGGDKRAMEIRRLEEVIHAHEQTIMELRGLLKPSETHSQHAEAESDDGQEPLLEQGDVTMDTDSARNHNMLRLRKKYDEQLKLYDGYTNFDEELKIAEREYKEESRKKRSKRLRNYVDTLMKAEK